MNTSRRDVLKAGMSLLLPTGVSSSIPESVIGRGGFPWDCAITGFQKFSDNLNMFRGHSELDLPLEGPPSEIERRDVLKIMLRQLMMHRELTGSKLIHEIELERDRERVIEITTNGTPELIDEILSDPNFLHHLNDDECYEYLTDKVIAKHSKDVRRLSQMSLDEIEKEYAERDIKRKQKNIRAITGNIIDITTNNIGLDITCRGSITYETISVVKDMVETVLAGGEYIGRNCFTRTRSKIGISEGKIISICIIDKNGKSYEYPKDHGKEWTLIED